MTKQNEQDKKDLALVRAFIDAEEARQSERAAQPYDGVLGELPSWFPNMDQREFLRLRNKILEQSTASPATVKGWIEAYRKAGEQDGRCDYWPPEFHEETGRLAQLYAAYLMGEQKGLEFLLGAKAAAHLMRGQKAAERPKEIQGKGVYANSDRADRFYTAVKDFAWQRKKQDPLLKATHIAKEIARLVSPLDATKRDLRFPTMGDGKPYSDGYILSTTRKALKDLA